MRIIEQGTFKTKDDITRLGFLDFSRPVKNAADDLQGILHWLRHAHYTVFYEPLLTWPARGDFPDWQHPGQHVSMAQAYWNWFHAQFSHLPKKELVFSDSPDFYGMLDLSIGHPVRFWGDIGSVSIGAFVRSMVQMSLGDLWITLEDYTRQIVIEARADFLTSYNNHIDWVCNGMPDDSQEIQQLSLW
jgi:hypothetical protein